MPWVPPPRGQRDNGQGRRCRYEPYEHALFARLGFEREYLMRSCARMRAVRQSNRYRTSPLVSYIGCGSTQIGVSITREALGRGGISVAVRRGLHDALLIITRRAPERRFSNS